MTSYVPYITLDVEKFIYTSTGNMVSRECIMNQPQSVEIPGGKCIILPGVIIHGDVAPVRIDKYTIIGDESILKPCCSNVQTKKFVTMSIGAYTSIGNNCFIESAVIGLGCNIGDNCRLCERTILKDHVHVMDGTVIPRDMVVPPFAIVSGDPGRIVGFVCESASTTARVIATMRYKSYKLVKNQKAAVTDRESCTPPLLDSATDG